jgi:heptosyltransferase-2
MQALVGELGLSSRVRVAVLMPGAEFGPSKMWPLDYFHSLARALRDKGFDIWICGSEKDRASGDRISEGLGERVRNLCGRTRLEDVADLLSVASIAITNDSGLMHVAAAVGCPVIALFGATTPAYTPPLTRRAHVFFRGIECSPCFERQCRFGHYACLNEIGPGEVVEAVSVLARQGADDDKSA